MGIAAYATDRSRSWRTSVIGGRASALVATSPNTLLAINDLDVLVRAGKPGLDYVTPYQTVCNYATLFFRNISSLLSVGDRNGTWQRFIIVATPQGPNNEGGPSSAPANGAAAMTIGLAFVGFSLPTFWVGLMLIMVFSVWLGWLPPTGRAWRRPSGRVSSATISARRRSGRS
jgi:hypothetical protein